MKRRIYEILDVATPGDKVSHRFDVFIVILILLNVLAFIVQTVNPIYLKHKTLFDDFEFVSVLIFSAEYILRVWSCTLNNLYSRPVLGRVRYVFTFYAIVDLLSVLPYWVSLGGVDARVLRVLRIFRLIRVVKLARYSVAMQTLGRVLLAKKEDLVISLTVLAVLLILASAGIYYVERDYQPEEFSSIPAAMWWGVATLTTVGYGDALPVTDAGKLLASFVSILGIGMFALPTGILGSGFLEEVHKKQNHELRSVRKCPHCGKSIY